MVRHVMLQLFGVLLFALLAGGCAGNKEIVRGSGPLHDACASGDLERCHKQATLLEAGDTADRRDALAAFQYGCLLKHSPSCTGLARMYGNDDVADANVVEALYAACDAGEAEACVRLGDRSPGERALAFYEQACEADHAGGCHKLARAMRQSWVVEENLVRALELDERACELGSTQGCVAAGQAYLFGSGVDSDAARGFAFLEKTCDAQTRAGCRVLGVMYEKGIGVTPDSAKAAQYYELAGPESEIVADSPATAYIVFVDACSRGNFLGCFDAAWFLDEGVEVERNITTSRELFEKACKGGVQPACERARATRAPEQG